jgi:hypothetical protein
MNQCLAGGKCIRLDESGRGIRMCKRKHLFFFFYCFCRGADVNDGNIGPWVFFPILTRLTLKDLHRDADNFFWCCESWRLPRGIEPQWNWPDRGKLLNKELGTC